MKKFIVSLIITLFISSSCFAETVVFNTQTHKYHNPSCRWAKKCTVNCIKIDIKQAKAKGGRPCKVCGG